MRSTGALSDRGDQDGREKSQTGENSIKIGRERAQIGENDVRIVV